MSDRAARSEIWNPPFAIKRSVAGGAEREAWLEAATNDPLLPDSAVRLPGATGVAAAGGSKGDGVAFVVLSLRFDPFITTAYLRRGSYNGLSPRDWRIFFGSVLLSNAAWALVCFGGVQALRRLW